MLNNSSVRRSNKDYKMLALNCQLFFTKVDERRMDSCATIISLELVLGSSRRVVARGLEEQLSKELLEAVVNSFPQCRRLIESTRLSVNSMVNLDCIKRQRSIKAYSSG
jgi:hypothetical protein